MRRTLPRLARLTGEWLAETITEADYDIAVEPRLTDGMMLIREKEGEGLRLSLCGDSEWKRDACACARRTYLLKSESP